MSTFFNRIIGNIATRVMFIIYISIIFITSFFIIFSYYNELELQTLRQYDKLSAIVSSAAVHLNGDAHEELIYRYSPDTPKDIIRKDPIYRGFSNYLEAIVKENDLSPMYTLIYIYDSTTSHFKITTPCKQPVGDYIRKTPFKCKSFQLNKGDVVYLFTDGYADEFGGEKGKKLKYQPFRNLLQTNVQNKMKDQEGALLSFLEEWMHDFEQVDDICVMGVRI